MDPRNLEVKESRAIWSDAIEALLPAVDRLKELGPVRPRLQRLDVVDGNGEASFAVEIQASKYGKRTRIYIDVHFDDGKALTPVNFVDGLGRQWALNPRAVVSSWGGVYGQYTWAETSFWRQY